MHLLDRQLSPPGGDRLYRQAKGAGRDLHHGPRQHGLRERAEAYSREIGYSIFVGVEFFSLWGDITAWGIDGIPDQRVSAQDFIDLVREKDGFCVSCHPFRSNNRGLREHLRDVHGLDGVEVLNGSTPLEENRTALRFCRELGLKAIGASDAHVPGAGGKIRDMAARNGHNAALILSPHCTRWKRVPPSGQAADMMSSPSFEMNFQRVGASCSGPFLHSAVSYPIFMQESCSNISQEPILPCKKILKIWRSGKLGIDIFPAWEYGNANNFKRPIARSGR